MSYSEEIEIGQRTWARSLQSIEKDGYREGAETGRNNALQEGFNIGYNFGFELASLNGYLKAKERFQTMKTNEDQDLRNEFTVGCVICSNDKDFVGDTLDEIKKKQKRFIEELHHINS